MDFKVNMILLHKITMYLQEADWVVVQSFFGFKMLFLRF